MLEHTKGPWYSSSNSLAKAHARLIAAVPDLLEACKKSPAPNVFAGFANFAEDCSTKPSMAIYRQQFIALSTFLRSCVDRSEDTLAVIAKVEG